MVRQHPDIARAGFFFQFALQRNANVLALINAAARLPAAQCRVQPGAAGYDRPCL